MAKRIGFIGLGTMGGPMSANLLKAGHQLSVYDLNPAAIASAVAAGARSAASPRDAAAGAEVVISMLPASPQVVAALLGPEGAVEGLEPGATLIDMSTIDPGTTRQVAEAVSARGAFMLDAPVSGSSAAAASGTLTIMVGGEAAVLDAQRDVLGAIGANIIHCGGTGMGETVKLCNNLIAGATVVAVAEAFALGISAGADPRVMFDVIGKATGNCWALQNRAPVKGLCPGSPVEDGFKPGFMVDLMHKDLGLVMAAGLEFKVPLPLTAAAKEVYGLASAEGYGRLDMSAVSKLFTRKPGEEVQR